MGYKQCTIVGLTAAGKQAESKIRDLFTFVGKENVCWWMKEKMKTTWL